MTVTTDTRALIHFDAMKKSAGVAYVLWFFFGAFGAHRFYLGRKGTAAAMLSITLSSVLLYVVLIGMLTVWVSIIWAFVDLFLIPGMTREFNQQLAARLT